MKKLIAVFGCLTVILALGGFTPANSSIVEYITENGIVTVQGVHSSNSQGVVLGEQDIVKIGDIITNNGVDEVVFAVADNGSYITMPVE